ncbi:46 kDa FK506-binding nuclear protein [Episyrphus balteatus]|uniref:46 kDa FK506-binding nuclear protein n=1 Tax=Episyrphus balteatus TaxID=286459 RepID=UPI002485447E|nr:46 kDa FK506-binding nuclear protein [Episyrphus balteatus]
MFWGLILKANKKYTQTTKQAFHVSQAALDVTSCSDGPIQLFLTYENIKYLICTLRKNTAEQVMLDLNFNEGDEISLQSQGNGTIHISGYITDLSDQLDDMSDEESDAMEEMMALSKKLKKSDGKANNSKSGKKAEAVADEDDDDDEEDDSDFNGEPEGAAEDSDDDEEEDDEDDDDEEGDDDDDDDDEEEDESEDEEVQQPKAKQIKLEKPKQNGVESQKKEGKQKKDKKEALQQQQAAQKQKSEQSLAGGVKIEDIRVGNGPEAKTGKRAQVYYEGRLKSNNKVFDSLKQGAPFKFGLGRGEVIKGWDVGVVGMKVGGKRRITCPAHMAYGARGSPPTIPPNSTLVFEVELKGVQ